MKSQVASWLKVTLTTAQTQLYRLTLLHEKIDRDLGPRVGRWVTHGVTDEGPGVGNFNVRHLQSPVVVQGVEREGQSVASLPPDRSSVGSLVPALEDDLSSLRDVLTGWISPEVETLSKGTVCFV